MPKDNSQRISRTESKFEYSLAEVYPEIASQWHPTANAKLTADDVSSGSSKRVWWQCPVAKDHVWQVSVANRASGTGCPFCKGRKVCVSNSLASRYPEIARQWHKKKNGKLTPKDVTPGSGKKVWWQCIDNHAHVYGATVDARTGRNSGCPYCKNKKTMPGQNSLAATHPKIAKQWHPKLNQSLTPRELVAGSQKAVWWQCPVNPEHAWKVAVVKRTGEKTGCPFCSNMKVCTTNSLAFTHPELAKEWHVEKNSASGLTPDSVVAGSSKLVWWQCQRLHSHFWRASIHRRANRATECPFCKNQRVGSDNNLVTLHPAIAAQWHPKKNGSLKAAEVVPGSNRSIWWQCEESVEHLWRTAVANRTKHGSGCPYCAGQRATTDNNLGIKYPLVAQQWNKERNNDLKPRDVLPHSKKKVWWKCAAGHEWIAAVESMVRSREEYSTTGCPACAIGERAKRRARTLKARMNAERRVAAQADAHHGATVNKDP